MWSSELFGELFLVFVCGQMCTVRDTHMKLYRRAVEIKMSTQHSRKGRRSCVISSQDGL